MNSRNAARNTTQQQRVLDAVRTNRGPGDSASGPTPAESARPPPRQQFRGRDIGPPGTRGGNDSERSGGPPGPRGSNSDRNDRNRTQRPSNNNNRRSGGGGGGRDEPRESGRIHTLLDNFGFLHCADRPAQLFFHYSEVRSVHPDELQIGDEVEFTVGSGVERRRSGGGGGGEKLAAFNVVTLPPNTIVWEVEEEPVGTRVTGTVESVAKEGRGESVDGKITVEGREDDIYYAPASYQSQRGQPRRLSKGDVVEFTVVTERRTKRKHARNIALVQSQAEKSRMEREEKLLEGATPEVGKVTRARHDWGFVASTSRTEEVYYHVSHVLPPDGEEDGRAPRQLREGDEVEFYVVDEPDNNRKGKQRKSSRRVKVLPPGSVKFEEVVAEGATGIVAECPCPAPFSFDKEEKDPPPARILLKAPLEVDGKTVTEVSLDMRHYPGGTFQLGRRGERGVWVRRGDLLRFDVSRKLVGGESYHAIPTKCSFGGRDDHDEGSDVPAVRLVSPSLCGRAEGTVKTVQDNYGFVKCAESSVDAYFPLSEVMPLELQGELARSGLYSPVLDKDGKVELRPGTEVRFDLSVQIDDRAEQGANQPGRRQWRRDSLKKESYRARRVQVVPRGTVAGRIPVADGVVATVAPSGLLELKEPVSVPEPNPKRHPLVAGLLDSVKNGEYPKDAGVTFHETMIGGGEVNTVTAMVDAADGLAWSREGDDRRIRIFRTDDHGGEKAEGGTEGDDAADDEAVGDAAAAPVPRFPEANRAMKERKAARVKVDKSSLSDKKAVLRPGDVVSLSLLQDRRTGAFVAEDVTVTQHAADAEGAEDGEGGGEIRGIVTDVVTTRKFGFVTAVTEGGEAGKEYFFHFRDVPKTDAPMPVVEVKKSDAEGDEAKAAGEAEGEAKVAAESESNGPAPEESAGDEGPAPAPKDPIPKTKNPKKILKKKTVRVARGDEISFRTAVGANGKPSAVDIKYLPKGTIAVVPEKIERKIRPKEAAAAGPARERPKLNLAVRKEVGGQIMAQTKAARGPDDTDGFAEGWTSRESRYPEEVEVEEDEEMVEEEEDDEGHEAAEKREAEKRLSIDAAEFVPTFLPPQVETPPPQEQHPKSSLMARAESFNS